MIQNSRQKTQRSENRHVWITIVTCPIQNMWKIRTKEGPVNVEVNGVRRFLIKFCCLVLSVWFPLSRGSGPAFDVSATWPAFCRCRSWTRSQTYTLSCQRSGRQRTFDLWSPRARSGAGRAKLPSCIPCHRQCQFQRSFPSWTPSSPSAQEVSETSAPASSSHRQGAEARKVKRVRSGKRRIRGCVAGYERGEAEAHLVSPSFHQSGMSSDDLFGEDKVESVRPGHVEALGAAYRSLESEGGVTGAAAFGTKRGCVPSAKIAIAQFYGWSSSGGFAEATCLEAEPGRGQLRITKDLVGGPHGGIVHFCATDTKICKAGWPGRRVYHFDIWRPFTITGNGIAVLERS